jgi:hypothetical protein
MFQSFDTRRSLSQLAAYLNVHLATTWRWTLKGVKGRKLRTVMVGGRRFVLQSDLDKFLAQDQPSSPSPDRDRRADVAGQLLDARGVRAKQAKKGKSSR